jgi:nicotinic acid mononucleotide adenylyltransferase
MIDTLESLQTESPMRRRLLIGSDQATAFYRWHRWADIINLATPLVLMRDQDNVTEMLADIEVHQGAGASDRWKTWILDLPRRPDSSSDVREHHALGHVSDTVSGYIQQHALYGVPA